MTKTRGNNQGFSRPAAPIIKCHYLAEPKLCFAGGHEHIDPKTGIARYGPKSLDPLKRHPSKVRVGFVGNADTVETAQEWISVNAQGVPGDEKHPGFPGCAADRGFHTAL